MVVSTTLLLAKKVFKNIYHLVLATEIDFKIKKEWDQLFYEFTVKTRAGE